MAAGDRKVLVTQDYVDSENDIQDNIILCCVTCLNTEFQTIKDVEKDWNEVNPLSPKFIKNKPLLRHSIADQLDTSISNLANDDILVWNSTLSKWENKALVIEPVTDIEQANLVDKVTPNIQNVNVLQNYTNTFNFKQTDTITISTVTGGDMNSSLFALKILKDDIENAYYITFKTLDGIGNIYALKLYSNVDKLTLAYWCTFDKGTGDVKYTDQTTLDAKAYYLKYKDTTSSNLIGFNLGLTIPVTIDATVTTPALKVNSIEIDVTNSNVTNSVLVFDGIKYKPTNLGSQFVRNECLTTKQDVLVSGTSIKTLNNVSLIGSGNINIDLTSKQNSLVSGTNIKTINGNSLLGSGDIIIASGGTTYTPGNGICLTGDVIAVTTACDTKWSTDTIVDISGKQNSLVSGTNIKTINGNSLLGSGDIIIASGTGSGNTTRTYQSFISTNNQTTFNFDFSSNLVDVYLNGIHLSTSDYTLGTNQVILNEALVAGELIDLIGYTISVGASASETTINPVGNLTSTNTQLALVELQTDIDGINTQLTGLAAALANINS